MTHSRCSPISAAHRGESVGLEVSTPSAIPGDLSMDREQDYLTLLYNHLDGLRAYASARLSKVLLESGGTPQARSERESFSQMYSGGLGQVRRGRERVVFRQNRPRRDRCDGVIEERYIGRLGILRTRPTTSNRCCSIGAPCWLARSTWLPPPPRSGSDAPPPHPHPQSPGHRCQRRIPGPDRGPTCRAHRRRRRRRGGCAAGCSWNAARTGHRRVNDIVEIDPGRTGRRLSVPEHKSVLVVQGGPGTGKTAVAPRTARRSCWPPIANSLPRAAC